MGHPQLNIMDALLHGLNEFINLLWRGRFLQLSVTSKTMKKDRVAVHNIRERCGIQNDKNRSPDRSLWDSAADGRWGRATVVYSYSLSSVSEVRREPVECTIMYAKDICSRCWRRMAWSVVSKAVDRSSRVRTDMFQWSREQNLKNNLQFMILTHLWPWNRSSSSNLVCISRPQASLVMQSLIEFA